MVACPLDQTKILFMGGVDFGGFGHGNVTTNGDVFVFDTENDEEKKV